VKGILAARRNPRENIPAIRRRRRGPGMKRFTIKVVTTSPVKTTMQCSAYNRWTSDAGR
jgi:hypothetical protein